MNATDTKSNLSQAMETVLASETFRNSLQSQKLLRYLLEHSLDGRDELLRERVIGVEVFGRQPGYDTNDESIVRVRANELRKRLAKYYQSLDAPPAVRFSLPPGSYRLEFQETALLPEPLPEPLEIGEVRPPQPSRRAAAGWLTAALLGGAGIYRFAFPPQDALTRFWRPILDHPRPAVICIPHPVLYGLSRDFRRRVHGGLTGTHSQNLMEAIDLAPDLPLHGRDIVTIRDQFVGVGTTFATAAVASFLATQKKQSSIRFGNDVSFEDFKNSPTILLAAYSNRWTLDLSADWRFTFADRDGQPVVRDRLTQREWRLPSLQPNGRTDEDYAILSRVFDSKTGGFLITAGGVTQYGTRSVGELITNPVLLAKAVAGLPPGWESRNLQILLHVKILGQVPAEPEIVAVHSW